MSKAWWYRIREELPPIDAKERERLAINKAP